MSVTLVCVVHGRIYEDYAREMWASAKRHFFVGQEPQFLQIEGEPGWPHASGVRYKLICDHAALIRGEHIFLTDADVLFVGDVGEEICGDGLTVTTHPGFPPSEENLHWLPFDREPRSRAYVPTGQGRRYYPGAFTGGRRADYLAMAAWIAENLAADEAEGYAPRWYDEAYMNRYVLDHPPAVELPREYCWWGYQWGPQPAEMGAKIMHRDKTEAEFEERDRIRIPA